MLLLTPVLWGATFPAAKLALEHLEAFPFMAWTRFLGLATIVAALPWLSRRRPTAAPEWSGLPAPGVVLGVLLFAGYALQTVGLHHTTATNAGFITGLYIVFVPLLGRALFGEATTRAVWAAVALSVVGLALLSSPSLGAFRPRAGDVLVLCCALAWAGHLVALGRYAPHHTTMPLAVAQMAAATTFHVLAAAPFGLDPSGAVGALPLLVITGVLGTGVAYTIQIVGQRTLSPARAAVILSGESLVSALLSLLWIGERLTAPQWLGAAVIIGAILLSELGSRRALVAAV